MGQKRVAAIHDISCFGKCSLTVALPVISAAGIETAVIPTAVLSNHTADCFDGFTFRDLSSDLLSVAKQWEKLNLHFDAIYTGYLGSLEQVDIVRKIIHLIKSEDTVVIVDPVMADHGKLYTSFSKNFPKSMARLCAEADIIIPNMTEAALLTETQYESGPYTKEYCADLAAKLCQSFAVKSTVLTGVYFDDKNLGAVCCDKGDISFVMNTFIDKIYHGTGDVFGSAFTAALVSGHTPKTAARVAVDFTHASIKRTLKDNPDRIYGVNFEAELPRFIEMLGK